MERCLASTEGNVMGLEEMKDKLSNMMGGKGDDAVDKAETFVDEKTGDKFDAQTDKAGDMAKDALGGTSAAGDEAQQAASNAAGRVEPPADDAAGSAGDTLGR